MRRIRQYPKELVHHKGLLCWLYTQGEYENAHQACEECLRRWPGQWWPNLMMVYIERKRKGPEVADRLLERFTSEHDDLSHWFLSANFHLQGGRPELARKEMARAARVPVTDLNVGYEGTREHAGGRLGSGLAWYAALACYRRGWIEETLAIANQWELYCKKEGYGLNYGAFQAACYLAQGKDEAAATALRSVIRESKNRNLTILDPEALDVAIKQKDHAYRWKGGGDDSLFEILEKYE